ncbi:YwiC-like family protein [Leptothermofonsia sichuanensis E412]|uniref:YwiC-like family protein n=1 Tax=Leptothermofonsia sichuanensis TaxID=2917832 RepID=UPI001CA7522E|nr:YwiC-like family protein [Leptothermofonsia sichuanensis]QZZ19860.1 YwiC-like family protein [Leptothermofonsia sichuanensis E412]
MTLSRANSPSEHPSPQPQKSPSAHASAWYRPTVSPEHGVYIVLLVSFLIGAAAAQRWTLTTTLAFICALAGFQSEHPLVLQIKQRRSWKPQLLLWGGLYGGLALGLAVYLYLQVPGLLWLYGGAIATLAIDALSVFYRQQKSFVNELLTFAAICLSAPFAYVATTGTWTNMLLGLWLLNTLFFGSSIFTVKLRKPKTASLVPGVIYHAIAPLIVLGLWYGGWLAPMTALAFVVVLLKFGFILVRQNWYRTTAIGNVALIETLSALLFLAIAAVSLLPARLM